jgi:HSP20 family protein
MARQSQQLQVLQPSQVADVDRTFAEIVQRMLGGRFGLSQAREGGDDQAPIWAPTMDVLSRDGDLVIRAELPGVDPERDIDITVQNGTLVIRGERKQERRDKDDRYYRAETFYGAFMRTVPLPEGVNPSDIRATYENGILEVVVPKAATAPSKKVPVTVGGGDRRMTDVSGEESRERSEESGDTGRRRAKS